MKANIPHLISHRFGGAFQRLALAAITIVTVAAQAAMVSVSSVTPDATGTQLDVRFSTTLCPSGGAAHAPNYSILSGAGSVVGATLLADQQTVRLNVTPALVGSQTLRIVTTAATKINDSVCGTNALASPTSRAFVVTGTLTAPLIVAATPDALGECNQQVTLHGGGFSSMAIVRVDGVPGTTIYVSPGGTEVTATFSPSIAPGPHSVTVNNPVGALLLPNKTSLPYALPVKALHFSTNAVRYASACVPTQLAFRGGAICDDPATLLKATPDGVAFISATGVQVSADGTIISGLFDFSSSSATLFNVVVQNPSGATATQVGVIQIVGPTMWGNPSPNLIGNCAPKTVSFHGAFCTGDDVRLVGNATGTIVSPSSAPVIASAGSGFWNTLSATFNLTVADTYHPEFKRGAGSWVAGTGTIKVVDVSTCPLYVEILGRSRMRFDRNTTFMLMVRNLSCGNVGASTVDVSFPSSTSGAFILPAVAGNTASFNIGPIAVGGAVSNLFTISLPEVPNLNTTVPISAVDTTFPCSPFIKLVDVVASADPNEKLGLAGTGPTHIIQGNETLPYEIHFENKTNASAPAQDVFISDQLNPAQFDLSTFSLGEITFGHRVITPPPGLTSFSDIVPHDLDGDPATTDDQMLVVLNAVLDTDSTSANYGRINWSYRTLDPATLESPADPDLGFLPPNIASPVGEGSVKFSVKLQPNLAPSSQMGSAAVIVFDVNAPIYTNPWFNQITANPLLALRQNNDTVEVEWAGAASTYVLQQKSLLGDGIAWADVVTAPVTVGSVQRVTLPMDSDQQYFRLRR